jgi:hypothetical protein
MWCSPYLAVPHVNSSNPQLYSHQDDPMQQASTSEMSADVNHLLLLLLLLHCETQVQLTYGSLYCSKDGSHH